MTVYKYLGSVYLRVYKQQIEYYSYADDWEYAPITIKDFDTLYERGFIKEISKLERALRNICLD